MRTDKSLYDSDLIKFDWNKLHRRFEVGTQKSEVGSRKSEVGSRKSEVGNPKSEVGSPSSAFVQR